MTKTYRLQHTAADLHLQDGSLYGLCKAAVQEPLLPLGNLLVLDRADRKFAVLLVGTAIRDFLHDEGHPRVSKGIAWKNRIGDLDNAFDGNFVALVVQAIRDDPAALVHDLNIKGIADSPGVGLDNKSSHLVIGAENKGFAEFVEGHSGRYTTSLSSNRVRRKHGNKGIDDLIAIISAVHTLFIGLNPGGI